MADKVKPSIKPVIMGSILAALIGLAIIAFLPAPEIAPPAVPVARPQAITAPEPVVVTDIAEPERATAPEPQVAADAPVEPKLPEGPRFDTFRVDVDGAMIIAGRTEPGQTVDVILAGEAIERVTADSSGSFVAFAVAGPSELPRSLSLMGDPEGAAQASETSYIIAPIAAPVVVAQVPEVVEAPALDDAPLAPQAPAVTATSAAPPVVLQADADGVRVVQDAATENVALDAITYDPSGTVQLAGRAIGDGAVQVYIDNEPLMTSPVTEGGDWQIALPEVGTGVYTLRIDEVDAQGDVVSRLETPFKREQPQDVAAVLAEETAVEGFEVAVKTVQPGATLWAIAEENLGSGILYIEVFEANKDLIRDPDLIYPGQIFRIPQITE